VKLAPLWQEIAVPEAPPFEGRLRTDVAVVGGGLTGLSAAYHLAAARPGLRVAVLEADSLGAGASGRNTGMLGPGVGQSLAALVGRLGPRAAAALYRETLRAVALTRSLIEREEIACDLRLTGQLLRARTAADRRRLARQADLMHALELPVEVLADSPGPGRLATGDSGDGPAALRLPHAGLLHPGKLVAGLATRAAARGVRLYTRARVRQIAQGRPVRLALARGSEVVADHVVIATAGYTAGLGLLRGRVLPVHLQALATAPLSRAALATLHWPGREGVVEARRLFNYFRLTADDRLVFGGGAPRYHWHGHAPAAAASRALVTLRRALAATFPAEIAEAPVTHLWTGVIGYTLDALPSIGRDPRRPGVVHALGWCGHGLALSVAAGEWLSRLILDPPELADLAQLAWSRAAPPALPGEALRWLSFRAAVGALALLDRVA
jgi:glycine/D-amino acid oxidase-like deaminating enzyme